MASRFCMIGKRKNNTELFVNLKMGIQKSPVYDSFQYFYCHGFGVLALGHINPFLLFSNEYRNPGFLVLQLAFSLHYLSIKPDVTFISNQRAV